MLKELKERFTEKPVLTVSDLDKKMRMKFYMSNYATGGVLFIEYEDGKW